MAKKNFTGGLSTLLGDTPTDKKPSATVTATPAAPKEAASTIRATFEVEEDLVTAIKGVAHYERLRIKDIVSDAFAQYLTDYEKSKGGDYKKVYATYLNGRSKKS